MIDIHTHLLPHVDDGVQSREEVVLLLKEYKEAGFSHIVCTPHLNDPFVKTQIENIRGSFSWFKQEAGSYGIRAHLGSELYLQTTAGKYIPFLDKFQLIETDTMVEPMYLLDKIFKLQMEGMTVILAHIERYSWFSLESSVAKRMREMGVLFQVNVRMLKEKRVQRYISNSWVDFIASDSHGNRRGTTDFTLWNTYHDIQERSMTLLGLNP